MLGVDGQRQDGVVAAEAEVEVRVHAAIYVQPGEIIQIISYIADRHIGEGTADNNPPIRLDGDGPHRIQRGRTRAGIEIRIHHTRRVEPHQVVVHYAVDISEIAAGDDAVVRLHRQGVNRAVDAGHALPGPR